MRWTAADESKFFLQIRKMLRHADTEEDIERLVALIDDTLLIYGCPLDEVPIYLKLEQILDFVTESQLTKKLKDRGCRCRREDPLALILTKWVGDRINDRG